MDAPTEVTIYNTSAYYLYFEWAPPPTPNGNITFYTVYIDYNNGSLDTFTAVNLNYTLNNLSPHQLIGVEISASTSVGEGPRAETHESRTHQDGKILLLKSFEASTYMH